MDSLKEIFGVTRERPEVNHELKKSHGPLLTLLPKQPLGTPTTFLTTVWPTFFFPLFSANWLSIALSHFGREKGLLITHSRWHISDNTILAILYDDQLSTIYSAETTEQLHKFPKKKTPVFTKDWMNNVASLLTYCSICWLGNNLTWSINSSKGEEFMHSRDLLDVIFLLGSFQVKNNIQRVHERHGLVWLIKKCDIPKRNALNTNSAYEINHRCTVFNTHTIAPRSSLALV